MKMSEIFCASFVMIGSVFYATTSLFAYPQSICADKILDSGEATGTFVKAEELENRWFAVIKMGEEDWHLAINYDDRGKYNSLKGKQVKVKYQLEQYFDEHDMECVRQEQLVSMSAASGKAQVATKAIELKPGYFKASSRDAEPVNIFLAKDGEGYASGSGYDTISWKQNGNTLALKGNVFMDHTAKVLSPTSFELGDYTYTIDPKYKATAYKYAEKGFSGAMIVIEDSSPNIFHINFDTFENETAHTCGGDFVCRAEKDRASCHQYGTDEPGDVTLKFSGNSVMVDTTYDRSEFCGSFGRFTGLYKK